MTPNARRSAVMRAAATAAVCVVVVTGAGAAAAASRGTWGIAQEVPGTGALNSGGSALVISMSCAAAGNCAAGGTYTDKSSHAQAFVANEVNGTWHTATEVPGTAALNSGGEAVISSVSCALAGNCAAGGYYLDSAGHAQAFVTSEVPGTATLNQGGRAVVFSVSCATAGNCAAGGFYTDSSRHAQAFVVNET